MRKTDSEGKFHKPEPFNASAYAVQQAAYSQWGSISGKYGFMFLGLYVLGRIWPFAHVLRLLFGFFLLSRACRAVLRRWQKVARFMGWRRVLHNAAIMMKLRYRQSLHAIFINAPGCIPLLLLAPAVMTSTGWPQAIFDVRTLIVVLFAYGILAHALICVLPPVFLVLGVSEHTPLHLLKAVQRASGLPAISLIDQSGLRVLSGLRPQRPGQDFLIRLTEIFPGVASPRIDSLRTRMARWQETVQDIAAMVPIVIVDTRCRSAIVSQEAVWMLAADRAYKAVFVTGDTGEMPVLEDVDGVSAVQQSKARTVTEAELPSLIVRITEPEEPRVASVIEGPLPETPAVMEAQANLNRRGDRLQNLIDWISHGGSVQEVNELIREWESQGQVDPSAGTPNYVANVDEALALVRRRIPQAYLSLYLRTDGSAWAEIGSKSSENLLVRVSTGGNSIKVSPCRAILLALLKAELGQI